MALSLTPEEAHAVILRGEAPAGLVVQGSLRFYHKDTVVALPDDLRVDELAAYQGHSLRQLPTGLSCRSLTIWNAPITDIPADLDVRESLFLSGCSHLSRVPAGLRVSELSLYDCEQ